MRPVPLPTRPGQESVWAYPRPPRLEKTDKHVEIFLGGEKIAETRAAYRVLDTSHPPGYYLPKAGRVDGERVTPQPGEFYGGWITGDVVGPFKGVPGSFGWQRSLILASGAPRG